MGLMAGIDEAGYGPHLGPLVVAAAALEFPSNDLPEPDLWTPLEAHVLKRPTRGDPRVLVCDSKVAYTGGNLVALERTVLGFQASRGRRPAHLAELLAEMAVPSIQAGGYAPAPWDEPEALRLPVAAAAEEIDAAAAHWEKGLGAIAGRPGGLWVSVASAARLNRLMDGTRNKAGALFTLATDLLAEVFRRCPDAAVHIAMDRHGGRRYYAGLLGGAFPMMPVETLGESPDLSCYRLIRGDESAPVFLAVRERCETWSLPTALASMAAKYVRELHMRQLNAYFQARVPGLKATAGYGLDAWRFLDDVAAVRAAAGVADAVILRNR